MRNIGVRYCRICGPKNRAEFDLCESGRVKMTCRGCSSYRPKKAYTSELVGDVEFNQNWLARRF